MLVTISLKGIELQGVLLSAGLLLLILTGLLGHTVLPAKVAATGNFLTDSLEYIKYMLKYRGGGLGMQIMLLLRFCVLYDIYWRE